MTGIDDMYEPTVPSAKDSELVAEAERRGFIIHKPAPPITTTINVDISAVRGDRVKLAVVSDTHLGSKYQQITYLREFLAYARKQRVEAVIHAGDLSDGPFSRHKNPHEVWLHSWDAQVDYAVEALPDIGKPWYVISGNHDDWWQGDGGPNLVAEVCRRRDDFTYMGSPNGFLTFGDVHIEVAHPNMGSSYALSYQVQKHVEGMPPEEKPHIYLAGNFHKACHLPAYRNVETFLLPAYQSRSHWMRGKRLASVVGGIILEFGTVTKGLAPSLKIEWVIQREPRGNDWPGG
jgi:predicted phosphodiesterase